MKLGRKDYTISVKTGTDANKAKFKKECVQGEIYHATDTGFFYIAEVTAGASDATLSKFGAPAFVNATSLLLDATNEYIAVGNLGTAGRSLGAISMWLNATNQIEAGNGSNLGIMLGFNASTGGTDASTQWDSLQYGYFSQTNEIISLRIGGSVVMKWVVSSGDKLPAGWHHLVVTHNGTGYTLYIDGVIATSNALGGSITTTTRAILSGTSFDTVRIGARSFGSAALYPFQGNIDEVALFDSALSASDITAIYNSGTPASLSAYSPSGWWRMGENDSGSNGATIGTVTDQGSGGNNGSNPNGATYSSTTP